RQERHHQGDGLDEGLGCAAQTHSTNSPLLAWALAAVFLFPIWRDVVSCLYLAAHWNWHPTLARLQRKQEREKPTRWVSCSSRHPEHRLASHVQAGILCRATKRRSGPGHRPVPARLFLTCPPVPQSFTAARAAWLSFCRAFHSGLAIIVSGGAS